MTSFANSFRRPLATLALFLLLAVVHTWPLASAPGTLSRNDTGDTVLHEWTLAWIVHQLPRHPFQLFDANIFYPEHDTLAYSDHLIVQAVMAAPVLWLRGSPVLAYNLVLLAGFTLTGWATCLVVARWTDSWLAGVLSGSLMAFNSLTLTRLPQLQDQHLEFFPLALAALDQLIAAPRVKTGLRLAGWYVLQALTCGYVLVFSFLSLVVAAVMRADFWRGDRWRARARALAWAGVVVVVVLVPFLLPYLFVSREQGLVRSLEEVAEYSAKWSDYLATGGRLHFDLWSYRFFERDALFPGLVATGLALVAWISGIAWKDQRARMALGFGLFACALSFGTRFPLYRFLYYGFPLMTGIRGAGRFGQFFLASIAILAGFGLTVLQRRFPREALTLALPLILVANLEALRAPMGYFQWARVPPIYNNLGRAGQAVVVCFPFYGRAAQFGNVRYMLASTHFWKPLLNGYSGFAPDSFYKHADMLAPFPDRTSLDYLRKVGVTHVVVETQSLSGPRLARLADFPELRLWISDGDMRIYLLN